MATITTLLMLTSCSQEPASVERKEHIYFGRHGTKMVKSHEAANSSDVAISAEPIVGTTLQSGLSKPRTYTADEHNTQDTYRVVESRQPRTLEQQLEQRRQGDPILTEAPKHNQKKLPEKVILEDIPSEPEELRSEATSSNPPSKPIPRGEYKLATPLGDPRFMWPVHGKVLSRFKNGGSEGMSISVNKGASILAAADGEVVYVGQDMDEYGRMLIIHHADNIFTAYAHNDKIVVATKDRVRKGQVIAQAGQTGSVDSPQLYFSIRKDDNTVDPERPL